MKGDCKKDVDAVISLFIFQINKAFRAFTKQLSGS